MRAVGRRGPSASGPTAVADLDAERLRGLLAGCALGLPLHLLDATASTNDVAATLAREGSPHGTLVVARRQTAGRGRHGRSWWHDGEHGLALSWLLRPALPAARATELVHVAALALHDALRPHLPALRLKWPNDLVVVRDDGTLGKLGGILVESSLRGARVEAIVVGVGLNVTTPRGAFAAQAGGAATSLFVEGAGALHGEALVVALCRALALRLDDQARHGLGPLLDSLRSCSATLGRRVEVRVDGALVRGQAMDLDERGALLVRDDLGGVHTAHEPLAPL